ncbi:hypothetical protein L211DRAFT_864540 [Terfezia boudieri ATCC MYA-4762]|uniref:CFEM domain-containing protein n=1 Tax=Terfezia boudieri ATCC MYA-4762 TaxID=1051890 RepID=A0A3N4M1G6_9PEZI|nr:hypothetical protein L211DRAFT_864540 [Terfezia boudieri ATCC MYA-4762]
MKSIFVVLATFAAFVVAQNTPKCAEPCIQPMLTGKVGNCDSLDVKCICTDKTAIASVGQCLIEQKCSEADIKSTIAEAYKLCLAAGVTIPTTIPGATTTPALTITTGTVTSITVSTATTTIGRNTTATYTSTTTVSKTSSTGAAATGYVANGLGVAGAAVAAFLFL